MSFFPNSATRGIRDFLGERFPAVGFVVDPTGRIERDKGVGFFKENVYRVGRPIASDIRVGSPERARPT
jgi:hypothetical protein